MADLREALERLLLAVDITFGADWQEGTWFDKEYNAARAALATTPPAPDLRATVERAYRAGFSDGESGMAPSELGEEIIDVIAAEAPALTLEDVRDALNAAWVASVDATGHALPPDVAEHLYRSLRATPPAPDRPVRIAGDDGPTSDVWTCSCGLTRPVTGSYGCADCGDGRPDSWDREPATPPAQPLPTEPDWGRMAYVLGLIGPVDTDDTEDAFVAYAEDIRAHYRRSDLETDPEYAAYVSRLSEARDE